MCEIMQGNPPLNESKRKRALRLLDETDPKLAKTFREELKKRKNEVEDNKDFKRRIANLITRYKPKLRYARLSDPDLLYFWALLEQRITGCIADTVARYFHPVAIFSPGKLKSDVSMVHKWPLPVLINEFHGARVDEKQTFQTREAPPRTDSLAYGIRKENGIKDHWARTASPIGD